MLVVEFFASFIAVPEIYDIKPGSIGRIHGDKKEAKPAPAETRTLVSTVILSHTLDNNPFVLIVISRLRPNYFEAIAATCANRPKIPDFWGVVPKVLGDFHFISLICLFLLEDIFRILPALFLLLLIPVIVLCTLFFAKVVVLLTFG